MRRSRALLAVALAAGLLVPAAAVADPAQEAAGRVTQKATEQVAASCRRAPLQRDECGLLLGTPDAGQAALAAYESSEVSRALDLQRTLGDALPVKAGLWIGTHNSANSTSELPSISQNDSNQQLSLTDQLRLDVRSLELDAHWFPTLRSPGQAPVLCHALPNHAGCSTERLLSEGLAEVAAWLRANPREVVLLYLEDHLDGQQGHDKAAADLRAAFGGLLFTPSSATECTQLPLTLTRQQLREAKAQVVVMTGGCRKGVGDDWHGAVFSEQLRKEDRPVGYGGYPACGGVQDLTADDELFRRYFEDTTAVNAVATPLGAATPDDGITPETAAAMTRCGVDLLGLDQLVPADGRLEALVWSFAPGQLDAPAGAQAVQRAGDGRWVSGSPRDRLPAACRRTTGDWFVTGAGPLASAEGRCADLGGVFDVPRRGRDAQLLLEAQRAAGADRVRLALASAGRGRWS